MAKKKTKPVVELQVEHGVDLSWVEAFKKHHGFPIAIALLRACGGCTLLISSDDDRKEAGCCLYNERKVVLYPARPGGVLLCVRTMISTLFHEAGHFIQWRLDRFPDFDDLVYTEKIAETEAEAFEAAAMALLGR